MKRSILLKLFTLLTLLVSNLLIGTIKAQEVEVQGELKVTQMSVNENGNNLVIHNSDGTLGTRSVSSLPPPPSPIDTLRNLASDIEVAKHLCDCPNLPPFLIQKLLESGYTEEDLLNAGVPYIDISKAQFTCGDTLVDNRDGNMYTTLRIGGQCWMIENLNIGTMINGSSNPSNNFTIEKYCYDNDIANCTTYGGLYQWNEMMQYGTAESIQGVCPAGWHLPSDEEYKTLELQLGMTQANVDASGYRGANQGSKLADNESLWTDGVLDDNEVFGNSGFATLPGGYRHSSGSIIQISNKALLWSSSESDGTAWYREINFDQSTIYRNVNNKLNGSSVRCVQD